jgi:hypothetical protein
VAPSSPAPPHAASASGAAASRASARRDLMARRYRGPVKDR